MPHPITARRLMPTDATPPRSMLERLADGHQSPAWDEFFRIYTPLLQFWLRPQMLQPADADDVVQDVLVVVLRRLPEFKPVGPGAFRSWLRTILTYRLKTHWGDLIRDRVVVAYGDMLAGLSDPSSHLTRQWDEEHDRHVVANALETVKGDFRPNTFAAFYQTTIMEQSPATVAKALQMTPNAVFIARSRVMRRLREAVAGLVDVT